MGLEELTIGEAAARSGVTASALRFYEAEGLIASSRTSGNQRRYARATLRRIALIQAGKAAGIPLEQIGAALAALPDGRTPTKRDWARLSSRWRADLDQRIATLEALRGRLSGCIGCGCLSLRVCRLLNPDDEAAENGAGPHYLVAQGTMPPSRPVGASSSTLSSPGEAPRAAGASRAPRRAPTTRSRPPAPAGR